ncbi:hypothetical protein [Sphingomonas sp. 1P08PE]|uniref:hypothetical protein n=1 Tax=Sphingomonas sp. 1P08PE TaxID=554122 RepID=UPI0039A01599
MAKDASGKGKTGKLPKRIGGIKLPKELRRTANSLIEQADSPAGRQVLAAGLTMAAAAASAALTRKPEVRPAASGGQPVPPVPPEAPVPPFPPEAPLPPQGTTRSPDPHEIGVALGKAAEQVLGAFLRKKPGV